MLVDTHCHIHDPEFEFGEQSVDDIIAEAKKSGVEKLICVGTSEKSSISAADFCQERDNCYASLALHPHEVANYSDEELESQMHNLEKIVKTEKVVAIGETGLDYFYHDDYKTHQRQRKLLISHIKLALSNNLPLIFHIRDEKTSKTNQVGGAFNEFYKVLDEHPGLRGVVHSFSASTKALEGVLSRGLFVGINGIMTFTKDSNQLDALRQVPLDRLLLETDAPFLTPAPFRGKICKPKHLCVTAEFISKLKDVDLDVLKHQTTSNAEKLFKI